eukprot:Platyproteum_vivax@DN5580_c0_g1_i3.p1
MKSCDPQYEHAHSHCACVPKICIFYLVLRALDTIEDDMGIDLPTKKKELLDFANHLDEEGWNSNKGYGAANPAEENLLRDFHIVISTFQKLKPTYQEVIKVITAQMATGMVKFLEKRVDTRQDWDEYCFYVAGLVGVGLSRCFVAANLNAEELTACPNLEDLSISMGRFLQKTNIIRDYLEDIQEVPPRVFYPKEVWSKYVTEVQDLALPANKSKSLACVNELVSDALQHVPDCLQYLALLHEPSVFRFAAIPQMMAVATLQRVFNNHAVFKGVVKVRKAEAASMILGCNSMDDVIRCFHKYLGMIERVADCADPAVNIVNKSLRVAQDSLGQYTNTMKTKKMA